MKGYILSLAVLISIYSSAANKTPNFSGKIKTVYICNVTKDKTELLRLYHSGDYEHLQYLTKNRDQEIVSRNIGKYELIGDKLFINKPQTIEFKGKLQFKKFVLNNHIYENSFDAKVYKKKRILFSRSKNINYLKPYYFCIGSDDIVSNPKINEVVNLKDITTYLLKDKTTEKEKVTTLVKFICHAIAYDYEGLRSNKYANNQNDALGILTSTNRVAVCAGYSKTFKALADSAGISAKYVTGYTKQSLNDLNKLGGFHAWNIVTCENKKYIIDVTWADNNYGIDSKWLFVNPELMLGSHLPDNPDDQLIKNPITTAEFINSSCIKPIRENATLIGQKLNAKQFVTEKLKLKFPRNTRINVTSYSASYMIEYYSSEPKISESSYNTLEVEGIEERTIGDSIEFIIPIKETVTGFSIVINNAYEVILKTIKGTKKDLMSHYVKTFDTTHSLMYVKGIIAAINLGDIATINSLLGSKSSLIVDKKKKIILSPSIMQSIKNWNGETSEFINLQSININNLNGEHIKTITEKYYVEIPGGPKFVLSKVNGHYELINIEK